QHLWLLCHLTERIQLALERLTDGFIYHIRKQQVADEQIIDQLLRLCARNSHTQVSIIRPHFYVKQEI
ncbi:hypothetical protein, partial [Alteromonas sp. MmMcT2-5]|uniref:hypothetical protein n=1 Tax=Alteromonas sp. MmMcT2-5 TaxID=2917733 RepID=UPI001EF24679